MSINGYVEIYDLNKEKVILEKQNTILPFGKYKIVSQLFQTKKEHLDGIKYLELFDTPFEVKYDINSYNKMNLVRRIQINRKDNIEILQYDKINDDWINYGNVLNQYYIKTDDYRKKYLTEYLQQSPNTQTHYLNLFNLLGQCINNMIKIKFTIPLYRNYDDERVLFNTMVLTYGGQDIRTDNTNKVMINEVTNQVLDETITNVKDRYGIWTSGIPFSVVELPEDIELRDQMIINWNFIFTFNE